MRKAYGKNKELYEQHYAQAEALRYRGFGYGAIAKQIGIPSHLVRTWVRHIPVDRCEATRMGMEKVPYDELVSKDSRRTRLIEERGALCQNCGRDTWMGKPIMLELHGHRLPKEQAKLLCPNCHAQTDDWRTH